MLSLLSLVLDIEPWEAIDGLEFEGIVGGPSVRSQQLQHEEQPGLSKSRGEHSSSDDMLGQGPSPRKQISGSKVEKAFQELELFEGVGKVGCPLQSRAQVRLNTYLFTGTYSSNDDQSSLQCSVSSQGVSWIVPGLQTRQKEKAVRDDRGI